jgi:hypothetical protein
VQQDPAKIAVIKAVTSMLAELKRSEEGHLADTFSWPAAQLPSDSERAPASF